jgi:leucyl-tRNA synthetase
VGVPSGADAAEIERLVLEDAKVRELLEGRTPKKVIIVPKRMVNLLI